MGIERLFRDGLRGTPILGMGWDSGFTGSFPGSGFLGYRAGVAGTGHVVVEKEKNIDKDSSYAPAPRARGSMQGVPDGFLDLATTSMSDSPCS